MSLGARGEKLAARKLKRDGFRIVERNYTCPAGEIDLIALDGDTLVFVEVKTRSASGAAFPEENVGYHKQRRLTRVARMYVSAKSAQDYPCRFDVVAVELPEGGKPTVEHFVNAFGPVFG